MKKLHLGCGKRYLPGYIHVDIDELDHVDVITTVENLSMFESNSIDEIYASHVLEYFDVVQVNDVLQEWYRVLKTKGKLRLAVPDFHNLVKLYTQTKDIRNVIGPIIGRWKISQNRTIFHKQIFDENSLKNLLNENGFGNTRFWKIEELQENDANYDDHSMAYFPHLDFENGIHLSLNLISEKL